MQKSDEEAFESMDKEIAIETIHFSPSAYRQEQPRLRRSQEDVAWKFTQLASSSSPARVPSQNYTRNISFEQDQCFSQDYNDESEGEEPQQSDFVEHYKNTPELYRKRLGFGTSWIGRKQYFSSVFVDAARIEKQGLQYFVGGCAPEEDEVQVERECAFDSEFESGNLLGAFKVGEWEYDLLLQNDLNTKGNTQWFYFRLNNPPRNRPLKLNIVNLRKNDSLFNYGMLPCVFSLQEYRRGKKGWTRHARHVKYFKNSHPVENSRRYYYTLTFTVSTPHENDVLRIAQCYPYPTSDLSNYLDSIDKIKYKREMFERETIVNTIGRNKIEALTIKQPNSKVKNRPLIFVMARQHPGESVASYMCEGVVDYLLSKEKEGEYLRRNYQIKVIPMVNPDGVAAGNYRTNLNGFDLNRRWDGGKTKNLHEAVYIKRYISSIAKGRDVAFILDLHGHSRKMFSFFYGNPSSSNPAEVRVFPLLCSKLGPNCVRFEDSTFITEDYKRNTARVQLGLSFRNAQVLTFQASFYGYYGKDKQKKHFTQEGYRQLGHILVKSLYIHERGKQIGDGTPDSKEVGLYKKCLNELRTNLSLISLGEKEGSGSESSPEECEIKENEEQKLEENEDYLRDGKANSKPVKIVKKILKKDPLVKEICKSTRQMQVLDIKQVNSIYPNNVLALIPSSYLKPKRSPTLDCSVQTDPSPLIRIYETCKEQEQRAFFNPEPHPSPALPNRADSPTRKTSNLLRSNILARPRSSAINNELFESAGFSSMSQRKTNDNKRRENLSDRNRRQQQAGKSRRIYSQMSSSSKTYEKGVQTTLSLSVGSVQVKSRQEREIEILEYKSIDPAFSTIQHQKSKIEVKAMGKTLSKNMFENMKLRRPKLN